MEQTTIEFTVGRLACGPIHRFLEKCKFKGLKIEFMESSGFLQRNFIVKGDAYTLNSIAHSIKEWSKEI